MSILIGALVGFALALLLHQRDSKKDSSNMAGSRIGLFLVLMLVGAILGYFADTMMSPNASSGGGIVGDDFFDRIPEDVLVGEAPF